MGVYSVLLSSGPAAGTALAARSRSPGVNGLIILTGLLTLIALFTVLLLGQGEKSAQRDCRRRNSSGRTSRKPSSSERGS